MYGTSSGFLRIFFGSSSGLLRKKDVFSEAFPKDCGRKLEESLNNLLIDFDFKTSYFIK
ncbi:hypothetical protein [Epilithonimonas vandammei]|uniref:hypothetical protein n=1 Tax=Epilithonimonas vandammei TaxID=2487072 RepID=UPI0013DE090E|nr:hypothetical protein [Epilithonimonas vandammei]